MLHVKDTGLNQTQSCPQSTHRLLKETQADRQWKHSSGSQFWLHLRITRRIYFFLKALVNVEALFPDFLIQLVWDGAWILVFFKSSPGDSKVHLGLRITAIQHKCYVKGEHNIGASNYLKVLRKASKRSCFLSWVCVLNTFCLVL